MLIAEWSNRRLVFLGDPICCLESWYGHKFFIAPPPLPPNMLILIETVHLHYLRTCLKSYLYWIGDARSVSEAEILVIFL
jgi:hypothetical protein